MNNETVKKSGARRFSGTVVSAKMKDTIVVAVSRFVKHPKYHKYLAHSKRFKVHDVGNTKQVGDKVDFVECRPISKEKRFRIIKI